MTTATQDRTEAAAGLVELDATTLAERMRSGGVVLIDVRERDEHARERIAGAISMPLSEFDASRVPADGGRVVVLHCQGGVRSADAAGRLLKAGRGRATHLKSGLNAWKAAGLGVEVDRKASPLSIMRQVQLVAGSLAFVGTVLGAAVSPWWLVVPGFIGAGLTFAGASGWCGLALVLRAMPWNASAKAGASCGA